MIQPGYITRLHGTLVLAAEGWVWEWVGYGLTFRYALINLGNGPGCAPTTGDADVVFTPDKRAVVQRETGVTCGEIGIDTLPNSVINSSATT
jgi:hypothetical protein